MSKSSPHSFKSYRGLFRIYLTRLGLRYPRFAETYVDEETGMVLAFVDEMNPITIKVDEELTEIHCFYKDRRYIHAVNEPITFERIEEIKQAFGVSYSLAGWIACVLSIIREVAWEVNRNWIRLRRL